MSKTGLQVTYALVEDTFREAFGRLIFWGFYGLSTAMILFFLFIMRIDIVEGARATISVFGQSGGNTQDVTRLVRAIYAGVATFLYTWAMALAVFASAGLIPSMLERGRIELMVSKPVDRCSLLLGRYLGSLLIVALNIVYVVVGVWLIFGWKTGVWHASFLYTIATATFVFAVLLGVVLLVGVLFESPTLATMVAFGLMILSPILAQTELMEKLFSSSWSRTTWKILYHVFPKVYDMGRMTLELAKGNGAGSLMPVYSSAAFAVVTIATGLYVFSRRDY